MNKYELVYIADARLTEEERGQLLKEVTQAIEKIEGKVINSDVWFEKQRFTFPIRKVLEGTYTLINFEAACDANNKLRQIFRLNDRILRSLVIKIDERKVSKKAPAVAA